MKAYLIVESGLAVPIFATNRNKALKKLYDSGYEAQGITSGEPTVIRKPEWDQYANTERVPAYDLVQAGLRVSCAICHDDFNPCQDRNDYVEYNGQDICFSCAEQQFCTNCQHLAGDEKLCEVCEACWGNIKFPNFQRKELIP
ncbi:hypothetical protein SCACP_21710 [Sporomusa carbonis]|uniref:hypothetical protein n=1 Tax=Sporomusa carbonis TaxID=3076075 RepID=UPI003A623B17